MISVAILPKLAKASNVTLYPWFQFFRNLVFWQAIWFLFFQHELSAAEAILLYIIYDIGTTALEVPSGYMSDRIGRRLTLIISAICGMLGALLLSFGSGFAVFALAQVFLGASTAFASGTDSSLLYESLAARGRENEIEEHELRAWRMSFTALAISAALGGLMATHVITLPFIATYLAFAGVLIIVIHFREPPHIRHAPAPGDEIARVHTIIATFRQPVLVWLFVVSVLMYGFSHLPFVFGQPFILAALEQTGRASETPIVSGITSSTMMIVSVLTSLFALRLRTAMGLPGTLLLAFGMQVLLVGLMAISSSTLVILLLFLRMVPTSVSRPFILAGVQPMLRDDTRATYLSLQSFCGRLLFAGTLYIASFSASQSGEMPFAEIRQVLGWYTVAGVLFVVGLAAWSTWLRIEPADKS